MEVIWLLILPKQVITISIPAGRLQNFKSNCSPAYLKYKGGCPDSLTDDPRPAQTVTGGEPHFCMQPTFPQETTDKKGFSCSAVAAVKTLRNATFVNFCHGFFFSMSPNDRIDQNISAVAVGSCCDKILSWAKNGVIRFLFEKLKPKFEEFLIFPLLSAL